MPRRSASGVQSFPSLVDALIAQAAERGNRVSLRQKRRGIWLSLTWAELLERVRHLAVGLDARGLRAGQPVLLIAENGIDWVVVDLALQTLSVPVIAVPPESAHQAREICASVGATVAVCGGHEHLVGLVEDDSPTTLSSIIVGNAQGVEANRSTEIVELADVEADGARRDAAAGFEALLHSRDVSSALLVPAETRWGGASPHPELATAGAGCRRAAAVATWLGLEPKDRMFPMLSLAIPSSRLVGLYAPLVAGAGVDFPENSATVPDDLRESAPTVACVSPRALALLKWSSDSRAAASAPPARWLYRRAMGSLGSRLNRKARRRSGLSLVSILVGRPVVRHLGLHRARRLASIEGVAPKSVAGWFWALGVPILEAYGTASTAGPVVVQHGFEDLGTTGLPLTGVDVRIDDAGELLVRGGGESWLSTGDIAEEVGSGRIRVRGPASARLPADAGRSVFVTDLEVALSTSAYISDVAIDGAAGDALVAYIELDYEAVTAWARTERVPVFDAQSLARIPAVVGLIGAEVDRCLAGFGVALAAFAIVSELAETTGGPLVPRHLRGAALRGRGIELHIAGAPPADLTEAMRLSR